jgi:hypothetical protein
LGFLIGRQFQKKVTSKSRSSGGGQDKQWFENQAELMRHGSQLRMNEEANSANIRDTELTRSYDTGDGQGHIQRRTGALRDSSRYYDDEGNVIGEVAMDDKTMGISTKGMRMPVRERNIEPTKNEGEDAPSDEAPSDEVPPNIGQQMQNIQTSGPQQTFLGIYKDPDNPDEVNNNWMPPVAIDKVNSDRDPDGTFTMGVGPGTKHKPMAKEYDKWKSQQDVQAEQTKAHLEATHPQKEQDKGGKGESGKDKVDVATPVAEAVGGGIGAAAGAAAGSLLGPLGTAAGAAGVRAIGTAVAGAVKNKVKKKTSTKNPAKPKPTSETQVNS